MPGTVSFYESNEKVNYYLPSLYYHTIYHDIWATTYLFIYFKLSTIFTIFFYSHSKWSLRKIALCSPPPVLGSQHVFIRLFHTQIINYSILMLYFTNSPKNTFHVVPNITLTVQHLGEFFCSILEQVTRTYSKEYIFSFNEQIERGAVFYFKM